MYTAQGYNYFKNISNCNAAIYARLSKEDEDKKDESESIQNQKDYCKNYAIKQGFNIVDFYCDDGYTGTNFERPNFKRLIGDIELKKVDIIITKDMSRLGRDYIDTGYYIEKFFPKHDVRYIAINDNVDTFSQNTDNDMTPFRSVINDMYAKDISKKVRSVMNTKRENGEFIGAFAPYGYKKSITEKNKLVVDENISHVVKRIFKMYIDGQGFSNIAYTLNLDGIICPGVYKRQQYLRYNNPKTRLNLWTAQTVKSILVNSTYAGDLAQGKYLKVNYKIKKSINVPKEHWIRAKNVTDPIVDKESFELVQVMINGKRIFSYSQSKGKHMLTGIIYCGDCRERMTFTKTNTGASYCVCSKYKRFKMCSRHSIKEKVLEDIIIKDLKKISENNIHEDIILKYVKNKAVREKKRYNISEVSTIEKRILEIKVIIKALYEDKIRGVLTEVDFIDLNSNYNIERERLNKNLLQLNKGNKFLDEFNDETVKYINSIKECAYFNTVDREIILRFIEMVEIFEDKKIKIYYKFKTPYEEV